MHVKSVKAFLARPDLPAVVFLFGQEEFLVDEATTQILTEALNRGIAEVDIERLRGDDLTLEALIQRAYSYPISSTRRIILVRHFDRITINRKRSGDEQRLKQFLSDPPQFSTLILQVTEGQAAEQLKGLSAFVSNPKERQKAQAKLKAIKFPYDLLIECTEWIEFPRLSDRQIPEWIINRFAGNHYRSSTEAAQYLQAYFGHSLRDLAGQIEKIMLYVGERRHITADDVLAVCGASRTYNIFELQKAIGSRDRNSALRVLNYMVRTERQELFIIAMLTRYFSILWRLAELSRDSSNPSYLARAVGISSFFLQEYLGALKNFTSCDIEIALESLAYADLQLKQSSVDPLTVLECAVLFILDEKTRAPLSLKSGAV